MSSAVEVELDVYSGRPNPSWTLGPTEAADFLGRLAALPAAAPHEPQTPLGYRGFVVRVAGPAGADELRVAGGRVERSRAGRVEWYGDPRRALERSLLDSGRAHLPDELYRMVREDAAR